MTNRFGVLAFIVFNISASCYAADCNRAFTELQNIQSDSSTNIAMAAKVVRSAVDLKDADLIAAAKQTLTQALAKGAEDVKTATLATESACNPQQIPECNVAISNFKNAASDGAVNSFEAGVVLADAGKTNDQNLVTAARAAFLDSIHEGEAKVQSAEYAAMDACSF